MKAITVTIQDIKSIRKLMDESQRLRDSSYQIDGYGSNYSGKEDLIESKDKEIENNINTIVTLLKSDRVNYNTVIDMCFDFEFAEHILNSTKV